MSATAKIDFEPGLFDEVQPEAVPDLPVIQPKRRANRAKFIVFSALLLVCGVTVALSMHKNLKVKEAPFAQESYEARAILPPIREPHMAPVGTEASMQPISSSLRWCEGDEVICITTISSKPAETLQKLIGAIPQNSAKQYQIRLVIVPVDDSVLPDSVR